jgi:hypothetical protein
MSLRTFSNLYGVSGVLSGVCKGLDEVILVFRLSFTINVQLMKIGNPQYS